MIPKNSFNKLESETKRIRLCVLGSTGTIGQNTLEIVRQNPELFEVVALAAGRNAEKLTAQIREFKPKAAALNSEEGYKELTELVPDGSVELYAGADAIAELTARDDVDVVVAAIVGFAALKAVLRALKANKKVALANKESLVCGGMLVKRALEAGSGMIVPVDSEHSAIFQALQGQAEKSIKNLILTASGGPFWKMPKSEFATITPEMALKHPKWKMGPKITIDSATMINKALELIEACWLFEMKAEHVKVLVHPQSIVHSIVELIDGTQLAQMSVPDMKGPIAYALRYPARTESVLKPLNLAEIGILEFHPLDEEKFPAVTLARQAIAQGTAATAVMNAANEEAVAAFLKGAIPFTKIVSAVEGALARYGDRSYSTFEELVAIDNEVRAHTL